MNESKANSVPQTLLLFLLTFVACGLRNFEEGLSVDGPLYADIARDLARKWLSGDFQFFRLESQHEAFRPFVEHPHLGFWTLALVFLIFPAADWSARMVGMLFYFFFIKSFFNFQKKNWSENHAWVSVLLLVSFYRFSNFFSNVYLDPGFLFFTWMAFVNSFEKHPTKAGVFWGLSFLQKGLTGLGLVPLMLFLNRKQIHRLIFGVLFILVPYVLFLKMGSFPEFLNLYFARQWSGRFEHSRDFSLIFSKDFWIPLAQASHWLLLLFPVALWKQRKSPLILPTLFWVVSFVLLYAPHGRFGWQYLLMFLPFISMWVPSLFVIKLRKNFSEILALGCLVIIALAQYLPIRIHGNEPKFTKEQREAPFFEVDDAVLKEDPLHGVSWVWYLDKPLKKKVLP